MPWMMMMKSREGKMVFNVMGVKLNSFDELSHVIKREIATNYPGYTAAPPVHDTHPNETTWPVFKKRIETQYAEDAKPTKGDPQSGMSVPTPMRIGAGLSLAGGP
jgi:hypothetical protein